MCLGPLRLRIAREPVSFNFGTRTACGSNARGFFPNDSRKRKGTWLRRRSLRIRRRITPVIAPASGGKMEVGNLSILSMEDEAVTGNERRVNVGLATFFHHSSLVIHHFSSAPAAVRFR